MLYYVYYHIIMMMVAMVTTIMMKCRPTLKMFTTHEGGVVMLSVASVCVSVCLSVLL